MERTESRHVACIPSSLHEGTEDDFARQRRCCTDCDEYGDRARRRDTTHCERNEKTRGNDDADESFDQKQSSCELTCTAPIQNRKRRGRCDRTHRQQASRPERQRHRDQSLHDHLADPQLGRTLKRTGR